MKNILKKGKNSKPTPEMIAESKKKIKLQTLKVEKALNSTKKIIDDAKQKAITERAEAIAAIERGDELQARMLSSMIRTNEISLNRNTNLYMLLLKVKEALDTKFVYIDLDTADMAFDLENDIPLNTELEKLISDIRGIDISMEIINDDIESIVGKLGSDTIFDELVREVKNKSIMNEGFVSSNDVTEASAPSTKINA